MRSLSRPYGVGDLVTRDGTDLHLVEWVSKDWFDGEFRCVQAPALGWTVKGTVESNLTRRYSFVKTPSQEELRSFNEGTAV